MRARRRRGHRLAPVPQGGTAPAPSGERGGHPPLRVHPQRRRARPAALRRGRRRGGAAPLDPGRRRVGTHRRSGLHGHLRGSGRRARAGRETSGPDGPGRHAPTDRAPLALRGRSPRRPADPGRERARRPARTARRRGGGLHPVGARGPHHQRALLERHRSVRRRAEARGALRAHGTRARRPARRSLLSSRPRGGPGDGGAALPPGAHPGRDPHAQAAEDRARAPAHRDRRPGAARPALRAGDPGVRRSGYGTRGRRAPRPPARRHPDPRRDPGEGRDAPAPRRAGPQPRTAAQPGRRGGDRVRRAARSLARRGERHGPPPVRAHVAPPAPPRDRRRARAGLVRVPAAGGRDGRGSRRALRNARGGDARLARGHLPGAPARGRAGSAARGLARTLRTPHRRPAGGTRRQRPRRHPLAPRPGAAVRRARLPAAAEPRAAAAPARELRGPAAGRAAAGPGRRAARLPAPRRRLALLPARDGARRAARGRHGPGQDRAGAVRPAGPRVGGGADEPAPQLEERGPAFPARPARRPLSRRRPQARSRGRPHPHELRHPASRRARPVGRRLGRGRARRGPEHQEPGEPGGPGRLRAARALPHGAHGHSRREPARRALESAPLPEPRPARRPARLP